jgi:hypothetical protein
MPATATARKPKRSAPWKGRVRVKDPKARISTIRWTAEQYATLTASADAAGLAVGPFLRTIALGSPGPRSVKRLPVEKRELARILGELGKIGSNCNQLAHAYNAGQGWPGYPEILAIRRDIADMRTALMTALGRER